MTQHDVLDVTHCISQKTAVEHAKGMRIFNAQGNFTDLIHTNVQPNVRFSSYIRENTVENFIKIKKNEDR